MLRLKTTFDAGIKIDEPADCGHSTAFHKQCDYAKKAVCHKKRFLRCAMLRIAPVEMTAQ